MYFERMTIMVTFYELKCMEVEITTTLPKISQIVMNKTGLFIVQWYITTNTFDNLNGSCLFNYGALLVSFDFL